MFDINTCQWVMWGAKRPYNTYGHIHDAFLRALEYQGKRAVWLDDGDDLSQLDMGNTLFLTMNCVVGGIPLSKECYYFIHNGSDVRELFTGPGMTRVVNFGVHISTNTYGDVPQIGPEIWFDANSKSMSFRWGTDLLPNEIEANKPARTFNSDSKVINYIGTIDPSNKAIIGRFRQAAEAQGIQFVGYGGCYAGHEGHNQVVSVDDNVRLIKESYMAPTLQRMDQVQSGYVPCRLFKNISYGQFGITHSRFANELFGGKLIYNPDPYRLFYDALERLQVTPVSELHALMDEVATKHTYLNKIAAIEHAVRILENK
jgi:hypothetical protein